MVLENILAHHKYHRVHKQDLCLHHQDRNHLYQGNFLKLNKKLQLIQ
jgi:hypothetical protein